MAHTTIGNLAHAPVQVLLAAIRERQPRRNSILTSALAIQNSDWANRVVAMGGVQTEIPLISPVPGGYTLQNPGTPPTVDNLTSGMQIAPVCYREKAWGADAFARSQSGIDPLNIFADGVNNVRFDAFESAFIANLQGIFKTSAFSSLKYGTAANEDPVGAAGSNVYWSTDVFHDTVGILGIRTDDMRGGVIVMHSKLRTYLLKQDEIDYVKPSSGDFMLEFYKGLRVVVDDRLVRAGTTSGYVYPFYICAPQTVILSVATQGEDGTTSSSLAFDADVPNLRKALYDRVVSIVHINGTKWVPASAQGGALTVAKGGPTDTQLATQSAWATVYSDVKNTRIVSGEVNI